MSKNDLSVFERTENTTIFLPPKPNGLIVDYNRIKYKNKTCMSPGCEKPTINSHVLSKASIRKYSNNQIIELQTINHDPFHFTKPEDKRDYYKPCNLDKISAFRGFCSEHDHDLFYDLDNYDGVISPKIVLLGHYRILCYGLNVIQRQLKQNDFLRDATFTGVSTRKTADIVRRLKNGYFERRLKMAQEDYTNRKEICEQMIAADSFQGVNFTYLEGSMNDALFSGRAGIFLHQFNRTRLPNRFMAQMPYITYFSICDGITCKLIFSYLNEDREFNEDLDAFINHPDLKRRLEVLIYSQSDFCILRKKIPQDWHNTIKEIIDICR